jgi:hypothetical protein
MKTQGLNRAYVNNVQVYTEDDIEFQVQLLPLIIKNIQELKRFSFLRSDLQTLREAAHKFKTSICMVNDIVLIDCMATLVSGSQDAVAKEAATREAVLRCDHVVSALEDELAYLTKDASANGFPMSGFEN